jgi:hypothetical protein
MIRNGLESIQGDHAHVGVWRLTGQIDLQFSLALLEFQWLSC